MAVSFTFFPKKWRGTGGRRPGEKGAGGVRETGEGGGVGSGIPKVAGSGRQQR